MIRNPRNTAANFRDFIGQEYSKIDPTYCHASAHPVEKDGETCFMLKTSDEEGAEPEALSVDKVAIRHLDRLRESASDYLGKPIDGVVIAAPTDFNEARRQQLVKIAEAANLKVLQVINEPTAALLGHVFTQPQPEDKIYVVADFGGTRSDAAVIASRGGIFTILGTSHDYELGGHKLDDALVDYVAKEFEKEHGVDPRSEARSLAKLKAESEAVRKTLSNTTSSNFAVESLINGMDYHTTINRLRFELTGRQVFNNFTHFVEHLVKKVGLDVLDVDEVLLVGGTSFTPKIASSLTGVFDEKTKIVSPSTEGKMADPNELVARGCAFQASLISGYDDEEIKESLQGVVTNSPHTVKPIGVKVNNEAFTTIVDIDTALPIRKSKTFVAGSENVLISIHEGESEIVTRKLEKPPKEEKPADDDESDWSDDEDEDEEVREKVVKPGKKLAELGLKNVSKESNVEVVLSITKDLKIQISARELKNGGATARGVTHASTIA